jgi:hypothetical protein
VEIKFDFIASGKYELESWADTKNSQKIPAEIRKSARDIKPGETLKVTLSDNGGWVGIIRPKN